MTITERIFMELSQKDIVQKDFATQIDVNEKTVSAWKRNNSLPPADKLSNISDCLGVSLDYLLTGEEKTSGTLENTTEQELLESYRKLSDFEKGEVLGDIKRRAANAEQIKKPNIQRVYQAARTYNREPIPTVIEADITPLLEAPDATDEY